MCAAMNCKKEKAEESKKDRKESRSGEEAFRNAQTLEYTFHFYQKAVESYEKACDQGHPEAQYYYGLWFLHGDRPGISKDLERAKTLFEHSAAQGVVEAVMILASMYEEGLGGFIRDESKALQLYRQAVKDPRKSELLPGIYMKVSRHIGRLKCTACVIK